MTIFNFTVEESNLIAIYAAATRPETLRRLRYSMQNEDDEEVLAAMKASAKKLEQLSDEEFSELTFDLATDEAR